MPLNTFNFIGSQNKTIRSDTDLVVTNGQTVSLTSGIAHQYNSVRVDSGGVLSIIGAGVTEIGVRNSFVLNGSIICRTMSSGSGAGTTSQNSVLMPGFSYSIVRTAASGGTGGGGGRYYGVGNGQTTAALCLDGAGAVGGTGTDGYGGGGGGGMTYLYMGGYGGSGGYGGQAGECGGQYYNPAVYPGIGANGGPANRWINNLSPPQTHGQTPTTRVDGHYGAGYGGSGGGSGGGGGAWGPNQDYGGSGGGGGGGGKGMHGGYLTLLLEGSVSGTGVIYANGTNGYNGGSGQLGNDTKNPSCPGGGGGGGAGGSGGYVTVFKRPSVTALPFLVTVSGGTGGSAGSSGGLRRVNGYQYSGYPFLYYGQTDGVAGGPGGSGPAGTYTLLDKPRS